MHSKERKHLAIELIRNDLRHTLLLEGLNRAGLDAGDYMLGLGGVVFTLMGLGPHTDKLYAAYLKRTRRVRRLKPAHAHAKLQPMAKDIYRWLKGKKQ